MNWEFISEANLQLTETEHQYYSNIFLYCCEPSDEDSVPVVKAAELLRSANLPRDVTVKILEICTSPKGTTHLKRKQFYIILKLVAAHQAGVDIQRETSTPLEVITALPRFTWSLLEEDDGRHSLESTKIMKGRSNSRLPESTTESESEAESPRETGGSTDSPTPTNSVTQERNEGILGGENILDSVSGSWQGLLVSEEQRQLLGTEEESSERHSSDEAEAEGDAASFPPEEVWIISDEQRDYYAAQFAQLQPDPEGLLAGTVARTFFEKSRLPVAELRRIWQLADVTRDGALSLQEFYVAMHLVVLRRNHVPLPDVLPPSLAILPAVAPPAAVVPPSAVPPPPPVTTLTFVHSKSKEWTKFVDSPTGTSTSLTSPGPKPVNFDFQKAAVERDPRILHPVPLRLTPEAAILASSANGTSTNSNGAVTLVDDDVQLSTVTLVQRPLAKKPPPAQPDDAVIATPKKEPPPPPPPRPYRTHTRSSSLDLNKLAKIGQNFLGAPPLVPPRVSPGITSPRKLVGQKSEGEGHRTMSESHGFVADFSHFSPKGDNPENQIASVEASATQSQQFAGVCGAFHIYRKPSPKRGEGEDETVKDEAEEERTLTLQELRDKNSELRLVCEELTRELAGALQERINLRAKLLLIT
ncbi:ralBP1-associated Eps domain-containing protein 1 isoform X2 [Venturia canescens]|uniref:ralBP1-associated Eps domain-containing protein 1 isoform X2 n=1 Tax=Venturia canescens TaxID=32260 RepID=UPI001C9C1E15|nr:ralBP1-associated Eps domain-containing protein 1 isoform X2 [Venturia canescens]